MEMNKLLWHFYREIQKHVGGMSLQDGLHFIKIKESVDVSIVVKKQI